MPGYLEGASMCKEKCLLCRKVIRQLDFYVEYPNGYVCGSCLSKQQAHSGECPALAPKKKSAPAKKKQFVDVEEQIIKACLP